MRPPSKTDALENKPEPRDLVNRDPSYPDRARIDSDVRAFLRPASSPWIVFDRDSRADDPVRSALRVGAVFASSPTLIPQTKSSDDIALPEPFDKPLEALPSVIVREVNERSEPVVTTAGINGAVLMVARRSMVSTVDVFPPSGSPENIVEPSNLVVATDVMAASEPKPLEEVGAPFDSDALVVPTLFPNRKHATWLAGVFAGVLVLAGLAALVVGRHPHVKATSTAQAVAPAPTLVDAMGLLPVAAPSTLELDQEPPLSVANPTVKSASTSEVTTNSETPMQSKKGFGKLSIKGSAKHKNVWFDGKRMLGSGQRSFVVFCGMHTIAVNDKADARDVVIPCNGEFTVWK